jgi:hypothetical protein
MTKEEILLKQKRTFVVDGVIYLDVSTEQTMDMMDEWAKEDSIKFAKWLTGNAYMDDAGYWRQDYQNKVYFTVAALYEHYKNGIPLTPIN